MSRFSLGPWRSHPELDVADELDFHFDETIRMLVASGMSPAEAHEEAHRRFGDRGRYQRQLERRVRRRVSLGRAGEWVASVLRDAGYAMRALRGSPTFTIGVVGTLAVAIGATVTIASIVNGVLIRPLPFPESGRLVRIYDTQVARGVLSSTSSPANFLDWRERQTMFAGLGAHVSSRAAYTDVVPAEDLAGFRVSAEWFDVLGIPPMLGRGFTRSEEVHGNDRVVVVSFDFWQRYLGARSDVIGSTIRLDGTAHEVIGVMPPGFAFPSEGVAIWRPLSFDFDVSTSRGVHYIYVIGRLAAAHTIEGAEAELAGIMRGLRESFPERLEGWDVRLVSLHEWLVGSTRRQLLIFLGAVALLLLLAAVNVANMVMVRTIARAREMALRAALGAGRWRLIRQLVFEGLALSFAAAAIGLLLGRLGLATVTSIAPAGIPRLATTSVNGLVAALVAVVALLLGAFLGIVPSIAVSRARSELALKAGGRGTSTVPLLSRLRSGFVVAQIALAMLLAIGAGLLLRSFDAITTVDPGYRTEQAWTATISLPAERYPEDGDRARFFLALLDRVRALPGVRSAAVTTQLPLEFYGINFSFWREGQDVSVSERPNGDFRVVTPGYFATMGIPVLAGREFDASDRLDAPLVILIDKTLAERYFPNEDPLGQLMYISYGGESSPRRVVGVVGDVKQRTLDTPASPGYYLPLQQVSWSTMRLVVRTDVAPLSLTAAVRHEVANLDPLIPVRDVRTLRQRFAAAVGSPRFSAFLLGLLAAIAAAVAVSGIYSVTSLSVAQRTHEIGVRMALGARASRVRRGVSREVIKLALVGVALAYVGAIVTTRVLERLLFNVSPTDSLTFVLAGGVFLVAAWLGGYVPARRASGVDPLIALRSD